jgi:hypothetical protein
MLIDLMPTMVQWRSKHTCQGAFETVGDWCDGNGLADDADPHGAASLAFAASHRAYMEGSAQTITTVNYFGDGNREPTRSLVQRSAPKFVIEGYQGQDNGNAITWSSTWAMWRSSSGSESNITVPMVDQTGETQSVAKVVCTQCFALCTSFAPPHELVLGLRHVTLCTSTRAGSRPSSRHSRSTVRG